MARVMFLSLYNELALGARLPSSVLREQGHETEIVLFKSGKGMEQQIAVTQEFDTLYAGVSWLYKALLIVSRFLLDDDRFRLVRNDVFLKDHPVLFLPMVRNMWASKFIESREPVMLTDMEMMRTVYEYYTKSYLGKPIIVWGTSGRYRDVQHLFKRNVILGFIDNDRSKQNTQIDGIPVYGPEFLHQHKDLPVFICTMFKKDVVRQIREQCGKDVLLP